jgi:hypothetical protein
MFVVLMCGGKILLKLVFLTGTVLSLQEYTYTILQE